MNAEGYADTTADEAVGHVTKEEKMKRRETPTNVMQVINMMKAIASVAGFEVVGRIHLKDKVTGKEWR